MDDNVKKLIWAEWLKENQPMTWREWVAREFRQHPTKWEAIKCMSKSLKEELEQK